MTDEQLLKLKAWRNSVQNLPAFACSTDLFDALIARLEAAEAVVKKTTIDRHGNHGGPGKCATCDVLAAWRRAAGKEG